MPKNKGGGRSHKRQGNKHVKNLSAPTKIRLPKESAEILARVTKMCGNGRAEVKCADGETRILEIRRKFRGRNKRDNMISLGTIVLAGLRDWEVRAANKKSKVDLLYVYSLGQHSALKKLDDARPLFPELAEEEDNGFDFGNKATWQQKLEENETEATETDTTTAENVKQQIGMNPIEDCDFDWDDI